MSAVTAFAAADARVHIDAIAGFERGDRSADCGDGASRIQAEDRRQRRKRQEGVPLGKMRGDVLQVGNHPTGLDLDQHIVLTWNRHGDFVEREFSANLVQTCSSHHGHIRLPRFAGPHAMRAPEPCNWLLRSPYATTWTRSPPERSAPRVEGTLLADTLLGGRVAQRPTDCRVCSEKSLALASKLVFQVAVSISETVA
ncbi:hypothetical protein D3C76_1198010 [compost metagenome]